MPARNVIENYRLTVDPVRRTRRLLEVKPGHIIIDTINADGNSEVIEVDYSRFPIDEKVPRNAPLPDFLGIRRISSENRVVYGYIDYDEYVFNMKWYGAAGDSNIGEPEPAETYPRYTFWDDSPQVPLVPTVSYTPDQISYPQKQEILVNLLAKWREQKREWLSEVEKRSDLHPELIKHAGYWLRAADRALQIEFQDPDVDPMIVAVMAQEAAKGAADIDSVDKFATSLNNFIAQFPTGPDRPVLWVTKGEGAGSVADVQRVNLADSHQYPAGTLGDTYNPIATQWQVPNQPGVVGVNTLTPDTNFTLIAEALDPDGVVGTPTYQWQRLISGVWTDEAGETSTNYLVAAGTAPGTLLRCLAAYTDNYGPNQAAVSPAITVQ